MCNTSRSPIGLRSSETLHNAFTTAACRTNGGDIDRTTTRTESNPMTILQCVPTMIHDLVNPKLVVDCHLCITYVMGDAIRKE